VGRQSENHPTPVVKDDAYHIDPGDRSNPGSYSDNEAEMERRRLVIRDRKLAEEAAAKQQADLAEAHQQKEREKLKAREKQEADKVQYAADQAEAAAKALADHERALQEDLAHKETVKHETMWEMQHRVHQEKKAAFAAKQAKGE
jgi:hypothetical protein